MLPNNPNVSSPPSRQPRHVERRCASSRPESVQAGLAAIDRYTPSDRRDENETAMPRRSSGVATGEVTIARATSTLDGIEVREGRWLGLVDGRVVACGPISTRSPARRRRLLAGGREILDVLVGAEEPPLDALIERFGASTRLDVEVQGGGQPHYPLLLFAE